MKIRCTLGLFLLAVNVNFAGFVKNFFSNEKNESQKNAKVQAPVIRRFIHINETFKVSDIKNKTVVQIFGDNFVNSNSGLKVSINDGDEQDIRSVIEVNKILKAEQIGKGKTNNVKINNNNDKGNLIHIRIESNEFGINYNGECYENQLFDEVKKTFVEKTNCLKGKKIFFVKSGEAVYTDKTVKENDINDNDVLLVYEMDEDFDENENNNNNNNQVEGVITVNIRIIGNDNINITSMKGLFENCVDITKIEIFGDIDTRNIVDLSNMFANCKSLKTIPDITMWDLENARNFKNIFLNCNSFDEQSKAIVTKVSNIYCKSVNELTGKVEREKIKRVFEIDEIFDTKTIKGNQVKIFGKIFVDNNKNNIKISINNGNVIDLCTHVDKKLIKDNMLKIKFIIEDINELTSLKCMFCECRNIKAIRGLENIVTNTIKDMSHMFQRCVLLFHISSMTKWDTSNVTNMDGMFFGCKSLKSITNVYILNTRNVISMKKMFFNCTSLNNVDKNRLGTANTDKTDIFNK